MHEYLPEDSVAGVAKGRPDADGKTAVGSTTECACSVSESLSKQDVLALAPLLSLLTFLPAAEEVTDSGKRLFFSVEDGLRAGFFGSLELLRFIFCTDEIEEIASQSSLAFSTVKAVDSGGSSSFPFSSSLAVPLMTERKVLSGSY